MQASSFNLVDGDGKELAYGVLDKLTPERADFAALYIGHGILADFRKAGGRYPFERTRCIQLYDRTGALIATRRVTSASDLFKAYSVSLADPIDTLIDEVANA